MIYARQSIHFIKIHPDAIVPTRGSEGAAGWDFYAIGPPELTHDPFDQPIYLFHTGIAIEIPPGYFMGIYPRSSLCKRGFTLANGVGVIDQDYRGEIMFPLRPSKPTKPDFNWDSLGPRLVQGILLPYVPMDFLECETLSPTKRGTGSFGASGV